MKIAALVPMKGNSERVPNKNLKDFNGRPLYHAIVDSLLKSKYITDVVIDTDSDKIASDVSSHFPSVQVLMRPEEIQGDFVSMNLVIAHDISQVGADVYIQTHSTNPLLKPTTLDAAISKYLDGKETWDSVFSVTKHQTRLYDKSGKPFNHNPDELIRTQDLEPLFEENSNFFIFSKESFERAGQKRIGLTPMMFEMDKLEATDIDNPEDFELAQALEKILQ